MRSDIIRKQRFSEMGYSALKNFSYELIVKVNKNNTRLQYEKYLIRAQNVRK